MSQRLIVVGVDGSSAGRRALSWALNHARDTGAAVEVVTAFRWSGGELLYPGGRADEHDFVDAEQEADLRAALAELAEPLPPVSRLVVEDDAVHALTHTAATADLLVVGSHGRGHLATALLGSVTEGCIRRGPTPVVVVPAGEASRLRAEAAASVPAARERSL